MVASINILSYLILSTLTIAVISSLFAIAVDYFNDECEVNGLRYGNRYI